MPGALPGKVRPMLRVGLTGGIGSGKSTAARELARLGAIVVDADRIAREVLEPGTPGLAAVVGRFGAHLTDTAGVLDRAALAAVVFGDVGALRDLEAITHPLIRAETARRFAAAPADAIVVHDMPLIVEKRMSADYHLVLAVITDAEERVRRLVGARGLSEIDARARIAVQAGDEDRVAASDVLLSNDAGEDALVAQVEHLWTDRLRPYAANLTAGVPSRRPERLQFRDTDPGWSARFERTAARLRRALGDAVHDLDHIGSTAVPGLIAKDVLDLQVGVASLDVVRDRAGRLTEAGFPAYAGDWHDRGPGGLPLPKVLLGNADPGAVCHIHVRETGSFAWRQALLFRDWLRATPAATAEYAALKRGLWTSGHSSSAYADAKAPWFDTVWERAQGWAEANRWHPGPAGGPGGLR